MGGSSGSLRILYVEYNDLVRDITCEYLSRPNRTVCAVGSAEEALAQFAPGIFDVVMTDVSLPGISGLELARRILRQAPETAIIVATGYGLKPERVPLDGRVRILMKPLELKQIEGLLHELCPAPGIRVSDGG